MGVIVVYSMTLDLYADSFSSVDVKCFFREPIENEELIERVHQIITAN